MGDVDHKLYTISITMTRHVNLLILLSIDNNQLTKNDTLDNCLKNLVYIASHKSTDKHIK